jgi:ADP-ribose pyrophosphatase YjhB (NUDIX family)
LVIRVAVPRVSLGALALIEDGRGRILLAHHTYRRQAWGLPGGFTRRGEDPVAGLVREIGEELGVPALVGPLVYAEREADGHHLTLYYRATLLGTPCADGAELDALRFVAPAEVPALFGGRCPLAWLSALSDRRASCPRQPPAHTHRRVTDPRQSCDIAAIPP